MSTAKASEHILNERGHEIVLRGDTPLPEVFIDGERITVSVSAEGYWSPHDAYRYFKTVEDLARAVAGNRPRSNAAPKKDL